MSLVELELLEDDGDGFDVGVPAEILFQKNKIKLKNARMHRF